VAVVVKRSNGHVEELQIALTAVNPMPVLVGGLDQVLKNGIIDQSATEYAGELAARTAKPLTTSALTPEYRREMIRVFTKRTLLALIES
jgi:carbon-monoxide dehydrogenase medium subunit